MQQSALLKLDDELGDDIETDMLEQILIELPIKYPGVQVQVLEHENSGFVLIARSAAALRRGGVAEADIQRFVSEAGAAKTLNGLVRIASLWVALA